MSTSEPITGWDPLAPDVIVDPYPAFARMRATAPVFFCAPLNAWVVSRYDDIVRLLKDTQRFSSRDSIYVSPVPEELAGQLPHGYPWDHPTLINADPPEHQRIRRLANQAFKPNVINPKEPLIESIADGLIDRFAALGRADLMAGFAVPYPGRVMCRLLGVAGPDVDRVVGWTDDFLVMLDPNLPAEQRRSAARGAAEFDRFCEEFVTARRAAPGDDIMSALITAHDDEPAGAPALTRRELVSVFTHLLIGGIETTRRFLGNLVLRMLEHPAQLAKVRADPGLASAAVEECLRHSSPTKGLFRRTTEDVDVAGTIIPGGALVVVMWASANHDERHFARPEELRLDRPDADRHLAFSRGPHFCIGAPLARMELRVALNRLLARLPNLRLATDTPPRWAPLPLHHGLTSLDLAWDPADTA